MGFLHELSKLLDFYSDFKNCVIMGDFNCVPDSLKLMTFLEENLFYNHMKSKTCFKYSEGSCIDALTLFFQIRNSVFSILKLLILVLVIFTI